MFCLYKRESSEILHHRALNVLKQRKGITGSVLLIIFKSLISLCFITCLIRISLNLKNDQKNRPHDDLRVPNNAVTMCQ